MAERKSNTTYTALAKETVIEVISIKGNKVFKKQMEYGEALKMARQKGWTYIFYQIGA